MKRPAHARRAAPYVLRSPLRPRLSAVRARRRGRPRDPSRRDARARRRVRLGQDDARAHDPRLAPVHRAARSCSTARTSRAWARGDLRRLRRRMQMIFQDPYSSLSPRLRVSYLLTEPYRINDVPSADQRSASTSCCEMVELSSELGEQVPARALGRAGAARRHRARARPPARVPRRRRADRRPRRLGRRSRAQPHEGPRPAARPDLPDHHAQPQRRRLHRRPHRRHVPRPARRGRAGGAGPRRSRAPVHARALLEAVSEPDPRNAARPPPRCSPGEIPSPRNPPPGCRFHTRCPLRPGALREEVPELEETERRPSRRVPLLARGAG